jgi:hypothetical protein
LFLRFSCSKQEKGIAECARTIMGWPFYHSDFKSVSVSLDINKKEIISFKKLQSNEKICRPSLLTYYAYRHSNEYLLQYLNEIDCFNTFAYNFAIIKIGSNKNLIKKKESCILKHLDNIDKKLVITTPVVQFVPDNKCIYQHYCYYQFIKYAEWDINTINDLNNNNAIEKWEHFIKSASSKIKSLVK